MLPTYAVQSTVRVTKYKGLMGRKLKLNFLLVLSAFIVFESQIYSQKYYQRRENYNASIREGEIGSKLSKRKIYGFFKSADGAVFGDVQDDLRLGSTPSSLFINSCPSILTDFFDRQRSKCGSSRSLNEWIQIAPIQGFGNQLNGVLQGLFSAAISQKCLHIDWKFDEIIGSNFRSGTFDTKLEKRRSKARKRNLRFPARVSSYKKFANFLQNSKENLLLNVHYRDRFCELVEHVNISRDLKFLPHEVENLLRVRGELCLFLENCLLQGLLESRKHVDSHQTTFANGQDIVALHIRTGDSFAFPNISVSRDERIPLTQLHLFWKAAEKLGKMRKHPLYYVASDNSQVIESAKVYFGDKLCTSEGLPSHVDLNPMHGTSGSSKIIRDWLVLAEADLVVHGPWSTFTEKALIYNYYQKKRRIIVKCTTEALKKCSNESIVEESGDWFCVRSTLRDSSKGPRSYCV
jgi:hypothetical protein